MSADDRIEDALATLRKTAASFDGDLPELAANLRWYADDFERRRAAALEGDQPLRPPYSGPMQPVHPCRQIPTRHCPAVYGAECGDRPCARFESEDETPWLPELPAAARPAEPDVTPPDPSGRIVDGGPVQPFTDTDHEVPHA